MPAKDWQARPFRGGDVQAGLRHGGQQTHRLQLTVLPPVLGPVITSTVSLPPK